MNEMELVKQAKVGRQALNIQCADLYIEKTSLDGKYNTSVERSKPVAVVIFNLETISNKEVDMLIKNGLYTEDSRILLASPEQFENIFPHRGESKQSIEPSHYWKPHGPADCECSCCRFLVPAKDAVERDYNDLSIYKKVKYRYCPNCGAIMRLKAKEEEA